MIAAVPVLEEWRAIPDTDGAYSVSSMGRIRRNHGVVGGPRILRGSKNGAGYVCCALCCNGRRISSKVHALVAAAFLGPRPPGFHVNHISGNKSDNAITNLEYVTLEENLSHARRMGIAGGGLQGSANAHAKLTADQVRDIRRRRPETPLRDLAATYGVTMTNISHIARRKTWRHID